MAVTVYGGRIEVKGTNSCREISRFLARKEL
jgi:hypothetical protein